MKKALLASSVALLMSLDLVSSACGAELPRATGVRARLYWVNTEIDAEQVLAPNQSPNVDLQLPNFQISGDERWFTDQYDQFYVLILEALVRFEEQEEIELRLTSEAHSYLEIDGEEIVAVEDGDSEIEVFEVEREQHQFKIVQYVNREPQSLELQWRLDDDESFEPLPVDWLGSKNYYFRPTSATAKRLANADDRPGKYEKVMGLFPGLDVLTIRPERVEVPVGGLDVLPDGRLVVASFDARRLRAPVPQEEPDGELWLYANVDAASAAGIQRELIAGELFEPCGVCVVGDSIFVSQRDEVTRFDYVPQDSAWRATTIALGWETNDFHALSFGLIHLPSRQGHPGYLYMARGTGLGRKRNPPNHGSVWRIDLARPLGANVVPITGGHRTPNGIGVGPQGAIFVTDNQGEWTPANELNHVAPGNFYGFRHKTSDGGAPTPFQDRETTHAAVILPQDEIANSPSEPVLIPDGWPYAGQMLVGDVKYGGINRVFLEKVNGRWQGAAFRFTQGLEGGVNRLTFGKDGSLFVGGMGGDHASSWHWIDPSGTPTYQGLQRLRPNGRHVFDLERVEATQDGFRIHFTEQIAQQWLKDTSNYRLKQWRYESTANYGGPKSDERELFVTQAIPSSDTRAVDLVVEGRRSGHVIHFVIDPPAVDGKNIWSTEAWYTLWNIPD